MAQIWPKGCQKQPFPQVLSQLNLIPVNPLVQLKSLYIHCICLALGKSSMAYLSIFNRLQVSGVTIVAQTANAQWRREWSVRQKIQGLWLRHMKDNILIQARPYCVGQQNPNPTFQIKDWLLPSLKHHWSDSPPTQWSWVVLTRSQLLPLPALIIFTTLGPSSPAWTLIFPISPTMVPSLTQLILCPPIFPSSLLSIMVYWRILSPLVCANFDSTYILETYPSDTPANQAAETSWSFITI